MIPPFQVSINPGRIIFGPGSVTQTAAEVDRLGGSKVLVLATPFQKAQAEPLADSLGSRAAGVFADATMHPPVEVTARAMEVYAATGADGVLALGGGSTIGLGKAIACRNGAPQIVVATTYARSEVTPILGQTENGIKPTVRGPAILPEVVIYDPDLTLGLPVAMSVASGGECHGPCGRRALCPGSHPGVELASSRRAARCGTLCR